MDDMTEPAYNNPPALAEPQPQHLVSAAPDVREDVIATLRNSLELVIGQDAVEVLQITPSTRLFRDLDLDSIQFMQIAEKVQTHYGVDSAYVMERASQFPTRQLLKLTVGDLVDLIVDGLQ
jgi:acyl carrier protein